MTPYPSQAPGCTARSLPKRKNHIQPRRSNSTQTLGLTDTFISSPNMGRIWGGLGASATSAWPMLARVDPTLSLLKSPPEANLTPLHSRSALYPFSSLSPSTMSRTSSGRADGSGNEWDAFLREAWGDDVDTCGRPNAREATCQNLFLVKFFACLFLHLFVFD